MRNQLKFPFFHLFMPKRKNRGALWASLIGIGISAVLFRLTKGRRDNNELPFSNAVKNFTPNLNLRGLNDKVKNMVPKVNIDRMDQQALAEFSDELIDSALNKEK